MTKFLSLFLVVLGLCGASEVTAQDAGTTAVSSVLFKTAANVYKGGGGGRYKPTKRSDPWSKIMNFYKPNGDEAQDREGFNVHELGRKQIYFGIALGFNLADYNIVRKPMTGTTVDTIKTITPSIGPGFNLGIIANWQFHRYFDLRLIPTLSFSDKTINYTTTIRTQPAISQTISSIYLDFPLQLRFKSDPIKNCRLFVIAGVRYDYDLASNSNTRNKALLKVGKHDAAAEYGIGVMIYFPYFIMTPEIKMSHGFIDVNSPTKGYIYSRVIERLYSRTFTFTINLEG